MTNEVLKLLENRRSCRNFKAEMPTKEEIEAVVKAGTYAPTGKGLQSPKIIVITDKTLREKFVEENRKIGGWKEGFDPFYGAPVIILVIADKTNANHIYDGSLVMGNLLNAAASLNLGSCWINRAREEFEDDFGKKLLKEWGIEGEYAGIGHVALGYAAQELPVAKPRKDDYVMWIE